MQDKFPSFSTYNALRNNPILFIDPDGNEIEPYRYRWTVLGYTFDKWHYFHFADDTGDQFDKSHKKLIKSSNTYRHVYNMLVKSSRTYRIKSIEWGCVQNNSAFPYLITIFLRSPNSPLNTRFFIIL